MRERRSFRTPARLLAAAGLVGLCAGVGGCSNDPGAVLIPMPERTAAHEGPVDVPATTPDGYPNVSAMPVVVGGTTLDPAAQAADEASLSATLAAQSRRRAPPPTTSAASLEKAGATHVEDAQRIIGGS